MKESENNKTECGVCGLNYRTLTQNDIQMHEKHCPYKDGNGLEQYHE